MVRPRPPHRWRPSRRWLAVVGLVLLGGLAPAQPAAAHGGGSDAGDFRAEITGGEVRGLEWRVVGLDEFLELRSRLAEDVVVLGYAGEPYLRFAPDGSVYENRRSPATYLNATRDGDRTPPDDADAEAPPEWERVATDGTHRWHDHRAHWMASSPPPSAGGGEQRVLEWRVPHLVGERRVELEGALWWTPPPNPWWWLAGATVLLMAPFGVIAVRDRSRLAPRAVRVLSVEVIVVAGLHAVRMVDDLATVPATASERALAAAGTLVWVGVAVAAAWMALRRRGSAFAATLLAGGAVFFGLGLPTRTALYSSYLQTSLPPDLIRAIVALALAIAIPTLVVAIGLERSVRGSLRSRLEDPVRAT